jgi:protein O-mannosyl-transferase
MNMPKAAIILEKIGKNKAELLLVLGLSITVANYISHLGDSFVGIDKDSYTRVLYSNNYIETIVGILGDFKGEYVPGYYAPLGSISLMLDKWWVGSEVATPSVTFLINVLIHCLNGILVFWLFRTLRMSELVTGVAAFIFLVHPVQVYAISWFAERKTLLAGAFYIFAYVSFLKFRGQNCRYWYGLSVASFCLGLLSKPTVVVLPGVLAAHMILCARSVFPCSNSRASRELLADGPTHGADELVGTGEGNRGATAEKDGPTVPFLILFPYFFVAILFSLLTVRTEPYHSSGVDFLGRFLTAGAAVWFYLGKILVPVNLVFFYPKWQMNPMEPICWGPAMALIVLLALWWAYRRNIPFDINWGIVCFLVPLFPVIGLVEFGYLKYSFVSGHFLYLSMIGAAVLIAEPVSRIRALPSIGMRRIAVIGAAAYIGLLSITTYHTSGFWHSSLSLWRDNVAVYPDCWPARNMLALALMDSGDLSAAEENLVRAMQISPDNFILVSNLGLLNWKSGKFKEAKELFERALSLNPRSSGARVRLGLAFFREGKVDRAIELYRQAIKIRPTNGKAYYFLAQAEQKLGKMGDAADLFGRAIRLSPDDSDSFIGLGAIRAREGKIDEAVRLYRRALAIRPDDFGVCNDLGNLLLGAGRVTEAIELYQRAIRIRNDAAPPFMNLGAAFLRMNKIDEAKKNFEKALAIRPNSPQAHTNLGIALAGSGNLPQAVSHFQRAIEINPGLALPHFHLGRAFEHLGNLPMAIAHYKKAIELQPDFVAATNALAAALSRQGRQQKVGD